MKFERTPRISRAPKEKTRGVLRTGSKLFLAGSVLLTLAGVVCLVMGRIEALSPEDNGVLPLGTSLICIAAGVLLLRSRKTGTVSSAPLWVLLAGAVLSFGFADDFQAFAFTVVLMLCSYKGFRFNGAPAFLPAKLRYPVLNLITAVAILLGFLNAHFLPFLKLLYVALFLVNLSAEAQVGEVEKKEKAPRVRVKSVPRAESKLFTVGAVLVIANGAYNLLRQIQYYSGIANLLWALLPLAAGILLVNRDWRQKGCIPAIALLLVNFVHSQWTVMNAYYEYSYGYMDPSMLKLSPMMLPVLLMLVAAIGISWNRVPEKLKFRAPALNLAAAALLAFHVLKTFFNTMKNYLFPETVAQRPELLPALLPLLLPMGLLLVNLAMDGEAFTGKQRSIDGKKYAKGFKGLVERTYADVGGGFMRWARIIGIIFLVLMVVNLVLAALAVVGIVLSLLLGAPDLMGTCMGLLPTCLIGAFASFIAPPVVTWPMYAFGQITDDIHAMRLNGISATGAAPAASAAPVAAPAPTEENPDQLPEL